MFTIKSSIILRVFKAKEYIPRNVVHDVCAVKFDFNTFGYFVKLNGLLRCNFYLPTKFHNNLLIPLVQVLL